MLASLRMKFNEKKKLTHKLAGVTDGVHVGASLRFFSLSYVYTGRNVLMFFETCRILYWFLM